MRLSVITGWKIPESEVAQNLLIDEFKKKIQENYKHVNIEEFLWAIRNYAKYSPNWGKELNLSLIDDILDRYLDQRQNVSIIEENQKLKNMEPIKTEKYDWQEIYEKFRDMDADDDYLHNIMPVGLYDWICKKRNIEISKEDKQVYFQKAIIHRRAYLFDLIAHKSTNDRKEALKQFNHMVAEKKYSSVEMGHLQDLSKKLVVLDIMKKEKQKA